MFDTYFFVAEQFKHNTTHVMHIETVINYLTNN